MAVSWNNEQLSAIETTDKGVIVSAAAGSGKTAVLIERTVRLLIDTENRIPADRLLAVTFTKDATNQMRDKLFSALENELNKDPSNEWIQKQLDNLNLAKINTINSFCFDLVKNNLNNFELQSGVKIIEEADAKAVVNQAIVAAFEHYFEEDPEMMEFLMDKLTNDRQSDLEKIVTDMYYFLRSLPFPDEWILNTINDLKSEDYINKYVRKLLDSYNQQMQSALVKSELALSYLPKIISLDQKKKDMIVSDNELICDIIETLKDDNWRRIYDKIISSSFKYPKTTLNIAKGILEEEIVKQQEYIDTVNGLRKDYKSEFNTVVSDIKTIGRDESGPIHVTADICEGIYKICKKAEEYAWDTKVERNVLEFSDVEMMAIKLLVVKTENGLERTELSKEIVNNKEYQVILIDEFQDVNNLQELLFKVISDTDDLNVMGKNVFVVGDVKQSIYRFRQSNPLLFIKAMEVASNESYKDVVSVQLTKNYRSRENVINYVNYTFSQLMSRTVGEIEYDENERLYLGAEHSDPDFDTEIIIVKENNANVDEDNISDYTQFDCEHKAIALRIKEIYNSGCTVEENGVSRPCRLSDFCVLSRNTKDGEKMGKALQSVGLSAFTEESDGYMRSREIAVMINLLKIIDNPMQDIPLVSIMMSSVLGFNADEVATIRQMCKDDNGYSKRIYQVINAIENGEVTLDNMQLYNKCSYAIQLVKKLRFCSVSMNLEHLIRKIYDETDFFAVASAFENSKQKRANLRLLLELASSYEANSDGGIPGFIRYLDSAEKYGGKFKQAVTVTESQDSVIVKTMHRSKGLEYPFVFLCGLSRDFNLKDTSKQVLFNEKYGIAAKISEHNDLSITTPVNYKLMQRAAVYESLSEELRLLYVAMTRAKEKLFIALNLSDKPKSNVNRKKLLEIAKEIDLEKGITPYLVGEAKCFAQWIYMTLLCVDSNKILIDELGIYTSINGVHCDADISFKFYDESNENQQGTINYTVIQPLPEKVQELKEKYEYVYNSNELNAPAKLTVTEIVNNEKEQEYGEKNPEFYPQLPRLEEEITKLSASEKGTYTHLFMELADYEKAHESVYNELERLYANGYFTLKEKEGVYVNALQKFFESEFYDRIRKSSNVIREKRFLVSFSDINVSDKYKEYVDGNGMLQGIADCIFEEDDGYVLVDYKTDNFNNKTELYKYQTQLELYKAALDVLLDKPVKSTYIYSFKLCMGVEISMKK